MQNRGGSVSLATLFAQRSNAIMTDIEFLQSRHSTPANQLIEPAPDDRQIKQILQAAMAAPDHGRLQPYRFLKIEGEGRNHLSDLFAEAVQKRDPGVTPEYLKKQADKPLRSPMIVVVIATLIDSPKVPRIEQILSAGSAAHGILLASETLGFGAIWLSGDNAYDDTVKQGLGVSGDEEIIGFVYLGTKKNQMPPRQPAPVERFLSDWPA